MDFRNFMVHEKTHGIIQMAEQNAIILHIEDLALLDKNDLPEDSRFLLEFDIGQLHQADFETQCYWVDAVQATRSALLGPLYPVNSSSTSITRQVINRCSVEPHCTLRWSREPIISPPTVHRPSLVLLYALEHSNRTRKPDWANCKAILHWGSEKSPVTNSYGVDDHTDMLPRATLLCCRHGNIKDPSVLTTVLIVG